MLKGLSAVVVKLVVFIGIGLLIGYWQSMILPIHSVEVVERECAALHLDKPCSPIESTGLTPKEENSNLDMDCLNINTASLSKLEELPGVGSVTAQSIVDARPFAKPEDLLDVKGIGPHKYSQIKEKICSLP